MRSTDQSKPVLLVVLDLSVVLDSVDHNVLSTRLEHVLDLSDEVLEWLQSYLEQWFRTVSVCGVIFDAPLLLSGVPQVSPIGTPCK